MRDLRNKWFPKADLCLLSHEPGFEVPGLAHALTIYDKPVFEFSWGSGKTFTSMTGRPAADYKALIELCSGLEKLVVQAVFITANATEKEVTSWIRKIEEIQPREIHVMTVPAVRGKSPKPLAAKRLETIAERVGEKTGIATTVISGETQPA